MKEAYLSSELDRIKELLEENDLVFDKLIDKTFYLEDNDEIVSTISIYKNIIKCIAIKNEYRSMGFAEKMISEIINYFYQNNITQIMVYTKIIYEDVFKGLGFTLLTKTNKVCVLEYGPFGIKNKLTDYKKKVNAHFQINVDDEDVACVVLNANPITNGHMYLLETASRNHSYVLAFVLEEDLSYFSYKDRFALTYLSCLPLTNVLVMPSTEYAVSSLTFPGYFLKNDDVKNKEWALVDSQIFKEYFVDIFNISKRYIGSEEKEYMKVYNETLKEILGNKIEEIQRISIEDEIISASTVRKLIEEDKVLEALEYIPRGARALLRGVIISNGRK